MSLQVRVDGQFLSTIGAWGDLQWSHLADGGCKDASWKMDLPPTFSHPSLVRNKIVEIRDAAMNVWKGILTAPDGSDGWTFNAVGLSGLGVDYLCLDAAGNTTSTPDVAIDRAIIRGLPWTRPASFSNVPYAASDATNGLSTVATLLNGWATSIGKRWGVDADGVVYAATDPVTPTWHLTPGAGRFGLADDEYASDLFVRYLATGAVYTTASVSDAAARAQFGVKEQAVDVTSLGVITASKASGIGNGLLAKGAARQAYTNGITVSRSQLTTQGGTPAHLPNVVAGQLVRQFGLINEQGQPLPYVDWVIGESKHVAGADTIDLNPVGLAARTLTDVLSLGGAA